MLAALKPFIPIAIAIEKLLHPFAEVVIHDLKQNKIAAIYNSFSKRKVHDSSLLSPDEEISMMNDCHGPYEKINWDGKRLKSITSLIKDEKNHVVGLICINLDISKLESLQHIVENFMYFNSTLSKPLPLFKDDWQEKINQYMHTYLKENHLNLDTINRLEKKQIIQHLNDMGAFNGKNAAKYIAQILKVSRATVYNYLSES